MKITIKKSKRFQGYLLGIDAENEALTVEDSEGKMVAHLVLEDLLDRIGDTAHGFKRQYPRLGLGVHVKYVDPEGRVREGIASTIGGGGLFIQQFDPLPEGIETHLEFSLPASGHVIKASAKVAWVREHLVETYNYPGMGLQYIEISERDRTELIDFINKYNQQGRPPEF